ncbi:MAG: alpha-ketoglutarate-dependent dioxygenase AlkB [Acidimicrobiales bacterium]
MASAAPYQGNLLATGPVGVDGNAPFERIELGQGSWVEVARGWLNGADEVAARVIDGVEWLSHRRWMYDRMVDEPRLSRWYSSGEELPDVALTAFRRDAGRHYGVRFCAMGLNYYRDGSDSVAFHSDQELKFLDNTMVAIVTLGAERPFLLRPVGGGKSVDISPASGDLLVMGGACQKRFEHAVPKVSRGSGPRVSASVRWSSRHGAEQKWSPRDRMQWVA